MENLDFSEEEIQQQLEALGYTNIPTHRLQEFKRDLDDLIRLEKSKSQASSSEVNSSHSQSTTYRSPPAFTKVKVHLNNTAAFNNEVFLPPAPSDQERQVLSSTYSRDNSNFGAGGRQEFYDSYTQHTVALRYTRPSTAPHRLEMEVEADLTDIPLSPFVVSQSSTPDRGAHGRPFIKRKVLRKRQGQVHVCDESTHSEDSVRFPLATMYKMYDSQWDEESSDENSSLNSSFWSDGDGKEDEEEKVERMYYSEEDKAPKGTTQHTQDEPTAEQRPKDSKQEESSRAEFSRQGDEERVDQEGDTTTSAGSPALSLLTSGYGTYRPDSAKDDPEEGGDYRDDSTIAEFDRESQSFSELRYGEEEDDRSLASYHGDGKDLDDAQSYADGSALAELEDREDPPHVPLPVAYREDDRVPRGGVDRDRERHTGVTETDCQDNNTMAEGEDDGGPSGVSCRKDGRSLPERKDEEKPLAERCREERENHRKGEKGAEDEKEVEKEGSASNKDIKIPDSKPVKTYLEWEDNRRPKKGAVSGLEDRLGGLHVSMMSSGQQESELESEGDGGSQSDRHSSEADGLRSAFESYLRGMARSRSESDIRPRPKSFIRPMTDHPHTRNLKKTDPVTKYFQYKQDWEMFKAPGEKDRKALHWEIREQLQYQPPPPKPRRTFVPNTYVVPTEKKRLALRWEVRHDLANGLLPPKVSYRL